MISIIAAIGKNRELGKNNQLLWQISEDLRRFKKLTEGHAVIMGRKTYQSIGRPLPNRLNIVITRKTNYRPKSDSTTINQLIVVNSLEKAIKEAKKFKKNEIFIIGGGQIYQQAIKIADKLYLTIVNQSYPDADTFFPEYKHLFKREVFKEKRESSGYKYTFFELEK